MYTVNWLINPITSAAIWNTTQTSTWQQANTTWNDTRLITDDISKQIARDNNTIQRSWVLNHQHGSTINEMMTDLQLRKLLRHQLRNSLPPQSRSRQDVRLIQRPNR